MTKLRLVTGSPPAEAERCEIRWALEARQRRDNPPPLEWWLENCDWCDKAISMKKFGHLNGCDAVGGGQLLCPKCLDAYYGIGDA